MTKEELTQLGISDEIADKIIVINTAGITAEQKKVTDTAADLKTANDTITNLTGQVKAFDGVDVDGLKQSVADWEIKYKADTAALKLDKALEFELLNAKVRDVGIAKTQIDPALLKLGDDGKLSGFSEQLEKLKTDKSFLFTPADDGEPGARVDTGLQHGDKPPVVTDDQARAVMGLPTTK